MDTFMLVVGSAAIALVLAQWICHYVALRRFVAGVGTLPRSPRGQALYVAGWIHKHVPNKPDDPPYLHRLLAPLGATPADVIHGGGCCSGKSRLYILSMAALGHSAHQVTLYHRAGHAQHCLVEVRLPEGSLIADPVYGMYYTAGNGGPMGICELQRGEAPCFLTLPFSTTNEYPAGDYYAFDFRRTRTANWTRGSARRIAYSLLRGVTRGGVDRLRLPVALEWPHLLLGCALATVVVLAHVVLRPPG